MKRLAFIPLLLLITGVSARMLPVVLLILWEHELTVFSMVAARVVCVGLVVAAIVVAIAFTVEEFDTQAIQGVSIDSDGIRNLVLGVTAADAVSLIKAFHFHRRPIVFAFSGRDSIDARRIVSADSPTHVEHCLPAALQVESLMFSTHP